MKYEIKNFLERTDIIQVQEKILDKLNIQPYETLVDDTLVRYSKHISYGEMKI